MNASNKNHMDEDLFNSSQSWDNDSGEDKLQECQMSFKNVRNKEPPWLENVTMTHDIAYRYTLPQRDLSEVLQKDLKALKIFGKVT
jgi:hypothetical protein